MTPETSYAVTVTIVVLARSRREALQRTKALLRPVNNSSPSLDADYEPKIKEISEVEK